MTDACLLVLVKREVSEEAHTTSVHGIFLISHLVLTICELNNANIFKCKNDDYERNTKDV